MFSRPIQTHKGKAVYAFQPCSGETELLLTERLCTKQPVHGAQSIFEGAISRYVCHYHRFAPYINIWQ